ncbi:NADH-quinone oxidoreductase subunit NuoF [Selenihalanaerobacter shriftii]|nr:NADH-quinone oxidoreductase subunit NuoF [Selenihalanaerobacter shriftii]
MKFQRAHILICGGTGCASSGCKEIETAFKEQLTKYELKDEISLIKTGCFGFCEIGPIVVVYPEGAFYCQIEADDVSKIVEEHLLKGRVVKDLLFTEPTTKEKVVEYKEIGFYKYQERIALRNCGNINPEDIEEYIAADGYQALGKAVTEFTPQKVIDIVKDSEIRGRGGGGFPTGLKWQFTADSASEKKHIICNADEGDPGAFMDRSILEGDPHSVLEAMAIAGYGVGANQGYIYVRAEYPIAVQRLRIAISQAREYGLLGENIFGSDFNFDIELRLGAGAFVCGEETALITSIEGNRGEPRPRPPYPASKGLWGQPTLINNVETYANIPLIISKGADWFKDLGTENSKGTKVFALAGDINNTGLVEVQMGTTLREVIYDIGGGIPDGKAFKAAQSGGPSGGCLPEEYLDIQIDYDTLMDAGSMMGSGGLIIMDEETCMVDIARFYLDFTKEESCGKCVPCREGTTRMLEILERITEGNGTPGDIEKLETLSEMIKDTALCGLGQTAPNPVLSTLEHFRAEYEAHIYGPECPAGTCTALVKYKIEADLCKGCGLCKQACSVGAIKGDKKEVHTIEQDPCIKCGACIEKCPFNAIRT